MNRPLWVSMLKTLTIMFLMIACVDEVKLPIRQRAQRLVL